MKYLCMKRRMAINKVSFYRAFLFYFFLSPSQLPKYTFIIMLGKLWATWMCLVCQEEINLIKCKFITSARNILAA